MSTSTRRLRQSVERLLFVLFFLGGGAYAFYWVSPLNLRVIDATITGATWLHEQPSGGSAQYSSGYDVGFTAKGFFCGFRYGSYHTSRAEAEQAFAKGDKVALVFAAGELDKAGRALGRDCLTGKRIPGTLALTVPSPILAPRLIEPLDVWRDGWVVLHWLPYRWLISILGAVLAVIGLIILFAPLIDRHTDPNRKARLGMQALSAFDEEARQRRERNR